MASVLPFNKVTIGSSTIDKVDFVSGSGNLTKKGHDKAVTTADGRIHNVREKINRDAKFDAYGDQTALNSATGLGQSVALFLDSASVDSFTGIVTASYNEANKTSSIQIKGDPS